MLPQLEAFVEVARRRSVTAAAAALYVTQPALSARLNALERSVGATLLDRRRRGGTLLTESGRAFLPYAERALESVAAGREVVAAVAEGRGGRLAIGCSPAVSTYALPSILHAFAESHPQVQLAVRTGHSEEVLELVKRGVVEVALIRSIRDPAVESITLYEDELVLVVHRDHPFGDAAPLQELAHEEFVLFDAGSSYHELTGALFRESGVAPRGTMELDNIDSAKKMVEQGLGIALLPKIAVADEVRAGRLRLVRILGAAAPRRPIVAVRWLGAPPPSPATAAFVRLLRAMRRELQELAG